MGQYKSKINIRALISSLIIAAFVLMTVGILFPSKTATISYAYSSSTTLSPTTTTTTTPPPPPTTLPPTDTTKPKEVPEDTEPNTDGYTPTSCTDDQCPFTYMYLREGGDYADALTIVSDNGGTLTLSLALETIDSDTDSELRTEGEDACGIENITAVDSNNNQLFHEHYSCPKTVHWHVQIDVEKPPMPAEGKKTGAWKKAYLLAIAKDCAGNIGHMPIVVGVARKADGSYTTGYQGVMPNDPMGNEVSECDYTEADFFRKYGPGEEL